MDNFSKTLDYRVVTLRTATEIVRFSFIARNSISYLDLGLCERSRVLNVCRTSCDSCALKLSKSFLNTEENCRKFFTPSRSLLYTLHLDLPQGRECSLKDVPNSISYERDPWNPHLAKIMPACGIDLSILSDLIDEFINTSKEKLKILSWILKMSYSSLPLLYVLEIQIANRFIDCFYPVITDSVIFKDFIMHLDFSEWISTHEKPEILEYLLYYARHYGRADLEEDDFPIDEVIDPCIISRYFLNISPILKYISGPIFSNDDYYLYFFNISSIRPNLTQEKLLKIEKWCNRERVHHMLRIIWIYIDSKHHHCSESASEALRLIWSSIPDAYITLKEMKRAFRGIFKVEEMKKMFDFYAKEVGESSVCLEPRSLKHLSRSLIRSSLRKSQVWIPEGIKKLCMPKSIESFLNLEKVFITSNKLPM